MASGTIQAIFNAIYPVGSIYMSVNNTSPATLFGGTWEQIQDTFLLAAGSTYAAGTSGGNASKNVDVSGLFAKIIVASGGAIYQRQEPTGDWVANQVMSTGNTRTDIEGSLTGAAGIGGSASVNVMPPYLAVYVWKRTA